MISIHEADPQSRKFVITISTCVICLSFRTFQNLKLSSDNSDRYLGIVGLAEGIIDGTLCLVYDIPVCLMQYLLSDSLE